MAASAFPVRDIISAPSTEQGPATTTTSSFPMAVPPKGMTVESGLNSLEASLYGFRTSWTASTPAMERRGTLRRAASSPTHPMMVRSTPWEMWVRRPADSTRSRMWSTSASVTPFRVMMIMF
jgi:hypothetical protein